MYLNIINNIKIENRRNRKNLTIIKKEEKEEDENTKDEITFSEQYDLRPYYSLFYGDLTNDWIYLKP